jgi:energy-coupling factor transporter ATP-binding protein EcfA2
VEELARRGVRAPLVVFGPEGCGKSAWLRQSAEILRVRGYDVVYVDLTHRNYLPYTDIESAATKLSEAASIPGMERAKLAALVIELAKELVKLGKKKVAVLVDEAFQPIGVRKAAVYVKSLLSLIEYPPAKLRAHSSHSDHQRRPVKVQDQEAQVGRPRTDVEHALGKLHRALRAGKLERGKLPSALRFHPQKTRGSLREETPICSRDSPRRSGLREGSL